MATIATYISALYFGNQTLNAQIDAIKETHKQFVISNRPLLQIENIIIDSIYPGKKLYITFDIANLGNYPAKIIESNGGLAIDTGTVSNPFTKIDIGKSIHQRYVTNNKPYKVLSENNFLLPLDAYIHLRNGLYKFYLFGEIVYSNETTETLRKYTYYIRVDPLNSTIEMINNDNSDL